MNRAVVLSCCLVSAPWANLAFSHAKLLDSVPAMDSRSPHSPPQLILHFSEEAKLAVLKLNCAGTDIRLEDRPVAPMMKISVQLPPLPPGVCSVTWSAIAFDDGHITRGSFSFTVEAP